MPYTTLISFTAGNTLPAADLNSNFGNLDYLRYMVNAQIQVTAGAMQPTVTGGALRGEYETATNLNNYVVMDFPDGSLSKAEFGFVLPSDYNGGTVTVKFIWTANSTSTNSVLWGIQGVCRADDDPQDVAYGTAQTVADANKSTAYDINITAATGALTLAGTPAAGEWAQFRVYRDPTHASDTLAATARLLGIIIEYTRA